jgi:two-component system cell cycle sensor histidine kinase/response regulator CckA
MARSVLMEESVPSLDQVDRARRARNTRAVALVAVVGSIAAVPVGLALGLPPLVAASFVALALVAAGVAWLAPSMASDWLPWILLVATLATAFFVAFPDRQMRAAQLTLLAGIAVAGILLPAVQVAVFASLAIALEASLLAAAGGGVDGFPGSTALAVAGLGLSVVVATAAALGARGTRLALGDRLGSDVRAREAEVRSEENAAAFRLLATCSSDLVFLVGLDGRVLYASPSVERLFGASLSAIQGRSFTERILDADRAHALQMAERAMGGGTARGTLRITLLDGQVRAYDAAFDASTSGAVRVVAIAARDVTEQLRLAEQLQQSQKLEAVGRLARGVAHDFANLLTVVQSGTTLAREALPPGHAAHADLADVSAAADRGVALARQLLAFTRPEGQGPQRVEVGMVLGQLARFIPRLMGAGIRVRVSEEVKVGEVPVSATQLEQVVLNLAINARDAMPRGGWIRIEARRRDLREGDARALARGPHVEIVVRDEGGGMSEDVRSHLFEPFFTTKGPGRGSGLGLATCLGIVEQAGGAIEVESEPGKGSTFRVLLPVASSPEVGAAPPSSALAAARRARILIVDHDPALVALLSRLLAARNHEVSTAASAIEARQQAASFPGAVDVVVTGLDVGDDHGVAIMGEVRRTSPQARAVLVTGEVRDPADVEHLLEAGVELVRRPVTAEALAEVVERVAGRAPVPHAQALA